MFLTNIIEKNEYGTELVQTVHISIDHKTKHYARRRENDLATSIY